MEKNVKVPLLEVIAEIKKIYLQHGADGVLANENWYLYTADDALSLETTCLISDPVEVNGETREQLIPAAAAQHDMLNPISCEIVNDVVLNALHRNRSTSISLLVDALNYYLENDCFLCV